jgi:hypothetical protein
LAVDATAFRIVMSGAAGRTPLAYIDVVRLLHGRGLAELLFVGVVTPPSRAVESALSQIAARRMKATMRGAS